MSLYPKHLEHYNRLPLPIYPLFQTNKYNCEFISCLHFIVLQKSSTLDILGINSWYTLWNSGIRDCPVSQNKVRSSDCKFCRKNVSYSRALATHNMRLSQTVKLTDTPDMWRSLATNSFPFFYPSQNWSDVRNYWGYPVCVTNTTISHCVRRSIQVISMLIFLQEYLKMRRAVAIVLVVCIVLSLLHERYDYPPLPLHRHTHTRLNGSVYWNCQNREQKSANVLRLSWRLAQSRLVILKYIPPPPLSRGVLRQKVTNVTIFYWNEKFPV